MALETKTGARDTYVTHFVCFPPRRPTRGWTTRTRRVVDAIPRRLPTLSTHLNSHVGSNTLCHVGYSDQPVGSPGPVVNFGVNRSCGFVPPGMSTATFVRSEKPMTRPFVTGSDTCTSGSKSQEWRRAATKRLAWSEKRAASRRWKNPKAPKTSHPHVRASCKTCVPISSNAGSVGQGLDLPFPSDWI